MPTDLYKRHKTRHPGITYRVRANGSRAYYVYAQGRQHAVEGGGAEALARQAELRGMTARGQRIVATKVKFAALSEDWLASKNKFRDSTIADYRADLNNVILPRFGHLKPSQITADKIAELIRELEAKGLSGARIMNILKPLKGVVKLAMRRSLVSQNPFDLLMSDERPRAALREHHIWSPEEIKELLAASKTLARKAFAKYDYSTLLYVAIYTGLRKGELLGLRWCDIDLKAGAISVRHQLSKKGTLIDPKTPKAIRRVTLAPDLVGLLTRYKLASGFSKETDFVFASNKGTPLNARNVATRGLAPALETAGLADMEPKITFHGLRHAFASIMIERGITSVVLANLMGHTDSRTTERIYIHLFNRKRTDEDVRAAMQSAMDL